jgi:hypothetical protein
MAGDDGLARSAVPRVPAKGAKRAQSRDPVPSIRLLRPGPWVPGLPRIKSGVARDTRPELPAEASAKAGGTLVLLERDELSLNRLLIPFVPAEAGTQFFGRVLGPWVPASAGTNGDCSNGGARPRFIPP